MSYVYWIYNDDCTDINTHGYVGVTENVEFRFKTHLNKNKKIPSNSKIKIIYEGSREDCFKLEKQFRPTKGIGWNSAVGGSHGWQTGFTHTEETSKKLKAAWTIERKKSAAKFKAKQNKLLKGQKRLKQSLAVSGEKNPMYGKTHSDHAKAAISKAQKNKIPLNKLDYYCILCHKRASVYIINKYHGLGKKNCKNEKYTSFNNS